MKCPRCSLIVTDQMPQCRGCGFSIADLDRHLKTVPKRLGFVNDYARLLAVQHQGELERFLGETNAHVNGEFVIVTVPTTRPVKPSEYAFWLFNRWQVGGEAHTGLLILIAQREHRVESEVGYGWEPIVSDVESGQVLDQYVVPLLREGKVFEALYQGVKALAQIISSQQGGA